MPLRSAIPAIRAGLRAAAGRGVERAAGYVADLAQQLAPVDTGALRASIAVRPGATETQRRVVVSVPYAAYVEYGTSRSPAQPFLTPAAKAITVQREVGAEIAAYLKGQGL